MSLKNILISKRSQTKDGMCTVWFHWYEVQEHLKLIYGDRNENSGWGEGSIDGKQSMEEFSRMTKVFHNLT